MIYIYIYPSIYIYMCNIKKKTHLKSNTQHTPFKIENLFSLTPPEPVPPAKKLPII